MPAKKSPAHLIVILDQDPDFLDWILSHLEAEGVELKTASTPDEAENHFLKNEASLLIAELHHGVELLKTIRMQVPNATVILNGAIFSTNAIIESMRLGAFDVLRRESLNFELKPTVERALQSVEEMRRSANPTGDEEDDSQPSGDLIIGRSAAMQDVYKLIGRVATANAPVLITGESGVGKEVVANAIHQFSRRAKDEFVAINCAAIPGNLLESELFGHEKGSFTGAASQRIGRFEQCDGGTLFLDEIGDMPLEVQSKLLRILQTGEFSRVGGNQKMTSDVRILAATNKRLEQEVEANRFREDLFYRLNVVRIHIPPLRRRTEDIRSLAEFFLKRQAEQGKTRPSYLSGEAVAMLESYHWPGNVRELENLMQRACVLASSNVLLPRDLPFDQSGDGMKTEFNPLQHAAEVFVSAAIEEGEDCEVIELATRELILAARRKCEDDPQKAAKLLGLTEKQVATAWKNSEKPTANS